MIGNKALASLLVLMMVASTNNADVKAINGEATPKEEAFVQVASGSDVIDGEIEPIVYEGGTHVLELTKDIKADGDWGAIQVKGNAQLTIIGNANVHAINRTGYGTNVWSSSTSKVIINGGFYTNEEDTVSGDASHVDLIYATDSSSIEIYGGKFKNVTPKWTLNAKDHKEGQNATITVYGGTYYEFDPAKPEVGEGEVILAEGYTSVQEGDWYTVLKNADALEINETNATLYVGNTLNLAVNPNGYVVDETVVWTSSDSSVATVENGTVKAIAKGNATITATVGELTVSCDVIVTEKTVSPSRPSTPSTSKPKEHNVEATTESGEKVKVEAVEVKSEVKETLGKENIVTSIQVEKTKEPVTLSVEVDSKLKNEEVFVVQVNPETNGLELVSMVEVDEDAVVTFTTDSTEVLTVTTSLPEGFISTADKENKVTYYVNDEGNFQKGWLESESGDWYYFDVENAQMLQERWGASATDWYFMGSDGKMLTNQWVAASDGRWYYVGSDGAMVVNTMIDGCYIDENGIYHSTWYQNN